MHKAALASFLFLLSVFNSVNGAERWECALDLQQGDKGNMSLERDGSSVTGNINIDRNGSVFTQELEGRWLEREVELKRFVDANSNQTMHGVAIRIGAEQVKMGGRYAEGLNGVWSADCDLISSGVATTNSETTDQSRAKVPPSISARTSPSRPNNHQTIQFAAQAFHPDGIESITIFVNDKSIKQCNSKDCTAKHGPLSAGKHQWHVIAKSKSGVENTRRNIDLQIVSAGRSGSCAISGLATGPAVAQSENITVHLEGTNTSKSTRFDAGTYRFDNLAVGSYTIRINAPASLGVLVSPATIQIKCQADQSLQQNFDFR